LGKADTNWTQEGTFQETSAFLAREPQIDAILYEYADWFLGGVRAYEQANRELDFVLTLRTDEQGLILEWDRLRVDNPDFKIFMSTGGSFQSRIALHAGMLALGGETIPANVEVPFALREVTAELYDSALPPDAPISSVVPQDILNEMFS
jgi:ribose transport system substrate-binding protein